MYKQLIRPCLFWLDAEKAHDRVSSWLHILGRLPLLPELIKKLNTVNSLYLPQKLFGLNFDNPIGLAAGMDKTGRALLGWQTLGFGFIEMGAVVLQPQYGNPRPRMFRFPEDEALINRMGFNSPGLQEIILNLTKYSRRLTVPLGINIGKNKETPLEEAASEYAALAQSLNRFADFFVVNVSSPNTPGLRQLQDKAALKDVLQAVLNEAYYLGDRIPVLVKISPDLTDEALGEAVEVCLDLRIDGMVATNTTLSREGLSRNPDEVGGLSGRPLKEKALRAVRTIHQMAPNLPIVGVGGIFTVEDAMEFLEAGAKLIQVFTGLVYEGPGLVRTLNSGLHRSIKMEIRNEEALNF